MMLSFEYFDNPIDLQEGSCTVLVIENKLLFRKIINSFENNSSEDYFIFSENFKPFDFSKKGIFISNIFNLELNARKLVSKINSYLECIANDDYAQELFEVNQSLTILAQKLVEAIDFDCEYNYEISASDIIKLLQFHIGMAENTVAENLVSFILLVSKYLNTDLFVISNLHMYFDMDELLHIYETLLVHHIVLIDIECFQDEKLDCEKFYILDTDLCEIDS